jgi:uncharacterized protein YneR
MTNLGVRECDQLKGASNFTPWKHTLQMFLEEVDLWSFVEFEVRCARSARMTNIGVRECDQLKGASNSTPSKHTLQMFLEEVDLWSFVDSYNYLKQEFE